MGKVLFKEEQRLTQWWMWLIMITSFSIPVILLTRELVQLTPESSDYNSLLVNLIVVIVLFIFFSAMFLIIRLKTEITERLFKKRFISIL